MLVPVRPEVGIDDRWIGLRSEAGGEKRRRGGTHRATIPGVAFGESQGADEAKGQESSLKAVHGEGV